MIDLNQRRGKLYASRFHIGLYVQYFYKSAVADFSLLNDPKSCCRAAELASEDKHDERTVAVSITLGTAWC